MLLFNTKQILLDTLSIIWIISILTALTTLIVNVFYKSNLLTSIGMFSLTTACLIAIIQVIYIGVFLLKG